MPDQLLIAAAEAAARVPADVARSLEYDAVVASNQEDAIALLESRPFSAVVVTDEPAWQQVRDTAAARQPLARLIRLPDKQNDDGAVRQLLTRYLPPHDTSPPPRFEEERYRFLSGLLESFTSSLDTREAVRRIVTAAKEELRADRAALLYPVTESSEYGRVVFAAGAEGETVRAPVAIGPARETIRRAFESPRPIALQGGTVPRDMFETYSIRSALVQVLRPLYGEPWLLSLACSDERVWNEEEISLFHEIGRYATLALNNAALHARAIREAAKASALLDQLGDSAAIYDASGRIERINEAGQNDPTLLLAPGSDESRFSARERYMDGTAVSSTELPSVRATRGETVKAEYLVADARNGEERVVSLKAAPIRDDRSRIIGAVVLSRDVTEERQNAERESSRRRRSECLASLGLEAVTIQPWLDNLDEPARRIAEAIAGSAMIYLYSASSGELHMVGEGSVAPTAGAVDDFRRYLKRVPYHPGEGVPGTVFQIGRPLFFSDIRGSSAILDFARVNEDRSVLEAMDERTLIGCPIESYGDRIGVLVIARSDTPRNLDLDDLEFAQAVADRIGAAAHIHRLTRVSQEGHRAAEELARREVDARVRFEAVLETAPIGIAVISADELRFELANARFLEFATTYGRISSDTKVVGLRVAEVLPGFETMVRRVAESGDTIVEEAWPITSSPDTRYANRIISPVRGRFSGITQSITVLIQDVTEQVRAQREIEDLADMMAERSARLDSILASMTDGLWVYDADGTVVDVNQAALTMFGLGSRTDAIEHSSFEGLQIRYGDGRPVPPAELPYARALRGEIVPDLLAIGKHVISGKDLDISIAAAPIESGGVVGAVLVIRDITGLQELDRKKDEFLSVASHELRTPLTTIKGYTQLLAQTINDLPADERGTYLTAVLGEIDRMMGLISELLDVSRIETNRLQIHPQPIRWIDFIERRAHAFRIQNPSRGIRFDAAAEEISVLADPDRMRQVIDNLLSNALKYSPEGSDVEVRVELDAGDLLTSLTDHGIGIPSDEIPQLFERFHRARNVSSRYYGGLGLGLYIAKAIVEAHRGSILVTSEEGSGSRFTIRLPLK